MKKRFVKLSPSEEKELKGIKKHGGSERERDQVHALLLSDKGHTIDVECLHLLVWQEEAAIS